MIGIYNTITIDNVEYPRPSDFELKREDVYSGEYETCTGKVIADRIGWRYSNITLKFDTLPNNKLQSLSAINSAVSFIFTDDDGVHTESVIRMGFENTPTRYTGPDGQSLWKNVAVTMRFLNAHND